MIIKFERINVEERAIRMRVIGRLELTSSKYVEF